ncbi:hypothetical protein [Candidatus Accumulibacter contiguus]|jgi:hypothetical protein|uniref:hypothetical protein n=1 Tax=Candidatus Accumulibacter contiguus TaxID=2954381 RepID=UPI002FC337B9
MIVKIVVFALIATPFLYGIGVALLQVVNISAGYGEGRILLAFSFFFAAAVGQEVGCKAFCKNETFRRTFTQGR